MLLMGVSGIEANGCVTVMVSVPVFNTALMMKR